jgi:hypothetical protein
MIQLIELMAAAFNSAIYCNCLLNCCLFSYQQANSLDQIGNWLE